MVKRSRTERAASAASRTAGRGIGATIGTALSSPFGLGTLGVVALLGGLIIFRDRISSFFAGIPAAAAAGLGDINIQLPEIKFPEIKLPEINFPDITLPSFPTILPPNFFGGGELEQPQKMVEDTGLLPDPTVCECGSSIVQDAFGNVNQVCKQCEGPISNTFPQGMDPALLLEPSDAELFASQAPTLTPAQEFVSNLPQGFEAFQTEGSSFVGAQINPTPIQNLSLSQIIDQFGVTASQAANIQAIAADDFGDFDFGTNTGGGIGSIIPTISSLIGGSTLNVSQSEFEGLSAQEIANILTGGNISNF